MVFNPTQETYKRTQDLIRVYRYNPQAFNEEQVDELQQIAQLHNLNLKRSEAASNTNIRRIAGQLSSGFIEGFTTIPTGTEPRNTYEGIAHSLGHLAGFAPGIIAAPVKLGSKVVQKVGFKAFGEAVEKKGGKFFAEANNWSIPMLVGNASTKVYDKGLEALKLESIGIFKKGAKTRAVLEQGVHLGTASSVSAIWHGPDAMIDAGVHGTIYGGAFGGLGEMKLLNNRFISKNRKVNQAGEQRLKGLIGASMMGLPPTLRGEPIELIMYETLLGGFFGYSGRPKHEQLGGRIIMEQGLYGEGYNSLFRPEKYPGWEKYSPDVQKYVYNQNVDFAKQYLIRQGKEVGFKERDIELDILEGAKDYYGLDKTESLSKKQINDFWLKEARDYWLSGDVYVNEGYDPKTKKTTPDTSLDANDPVEIGAEKTNKQREINSRYEDQNVIAIEMDANGNVRLVGNTGKNIGIKGKVDGKDLGDRRIDRPETNLTGQEHITFDTILVKRKNRITKRVPLDREPNQDGKFENVINGKQRYQIDVNLHKLNKYITSGVKDKGIFIVKDYHPDVIRDSKGEYTSFNMHNLKDHVIEMLSKNESLSTAEQLQIKNELRKSFNESLEIAIKDWAGGWGNKDAVTKMHEKQWLSNVLDLAEANGLYVKGSRDLSRINEMSGEGFYKNVVDFNKRTQLLHDKGVPMPEGIIPRRELAIFDDIIFEEYTGLDKNNKPEKRKFDSDTDGTIYFLPKEFDRVQQELGLPENVSMAKPVIVAKLQNGGYLLVKAASRRADPIIEKFMIDNGLNTMILKSAAKHTGSLKSNKLEYDPVKKEYKTSENIERTYIDPTSIRMNMGTYENPSRATKSQMIVRQLTTVLNSKQTKKGIDDIYKEMYQPSILGDKAKNELVDSYINDPKNAPEINKAIEIHKEITDLTKKLYTSPNPESQASIRKQIDSRIESLRKTIHVDEVGIKFIDKVMRKSGDDPLAQIFAQQIAKMENAGQLENPDFFNASEWASYRMKSQRIQMIGKMNESIREGMPFGMSTTWDKTYKKYMLTRVMSPKWKYSAKSWLAPKPRHMDVEAGTFKLDDGMKQMNIKYDFGKGQVDTTLGKAWNHFKKKGGDKSAFEFLVIRVPADSISGTRLLEFKGFTGEKGVSIFTNGKDNMYLGGADKDSDSAFLYQGLSKKVKDHYKKNQKEWETKKDHPEGEGHMIDAKAEKYDSIFGSDPAKDAPYKTFGSIFSPSMRKMTAKTARNGQQGLGYGLNARNSMIAWADVILDKSKNKKDIFVTDKEGNSYRVTLLEGGYKRLLELGREIVNRSADASNYPNMIGYESFPDILLKSTFRVEKKERDSSTYVDITPNEGTYNLLKNKTRLGSISKMTKDLDPSKSEVSWKNLDQALDKYSSDIKLFEGTLFGKAAKELRDSGVLKNTSDIDTMINISKAMEQYKDIVLQRSSPKTAEGRAIAEINNLISLDLPKFNIDKYLKDNTWENALNWMRKDLFNLSSHSAITKKGYEIYNAFKDSGFTWKGKEIDARHVAKYLRSIADEATIIKLKLDNYNLNTKEGGVEKYQLEWYDRHIQEFKDIKINGIIAKLNKGNKNNKVTSEMLHDYFDLWLLSPFHRNTGKAGTYTKDFRGNDIFVDEFAPGKKQGFGRQVDTTEGEVGMYTTKVFLVERQIPFQSQQISNRSIDFLLTEHSNIYNSFFKPETPLEKTKLLEIYEKVKVPDKPTEMDYPDQIRKLVLEKVNPTQDPTKDLGVIKRRAITEADAKEVKKLNDYLNENPFIKDNFNSFFENFTLDIGKELPRDITTITMADIYALNSYFKDIDLRLKKSGQKLPSNAWRTSPTYMNEKMFAVEQKFFESYQTPIRTKDRQGKDKVVIRTFKQMTGTLGRIRENIRTMNRLIDSRTQNIELENDTIFPFRRDLEPRDADLINKIVIAKREGGDITKLKGYNELKNKTFKVEGKELTFDQLVTNIDNAYTNFFKEWSKKYVHAYDSKGNKVDFNNIDRKFEYKEYNEYLKWDKNGKFDIDNFLNKTLRIMEKGKDIPEIPVEVLLRVQYERFVEAAVNRAYNHPSNDPKRNRSLTKETSKKTFRELFRKGEILIDKQQLELGEYVIKGSKFKRIGEQRYEEYVPHINFGRNKGAEKEMKAWIEAEADKAYQTKLNETGDKTLAEREKQLVLFKHFVRSENSAKLDGGAAKQAIESIMFDLDKMDFRDMESLGMNQRPSSALERTGNMPGWDKSINMIDIYKDQWVRASHKNLMAIFANKHIDTFIKKKQFGKYTKDWATYLRAYFKDSMGQPTIFGNQLKAFLEADPKFKRRMYYLTSDHAVIKSMDWVEKQFSKLGMKTPFLDKAPPKPKFKREVDPVLFDTMMTARMEYLTRNIHKFGSMEAKYNVITLLAHPKLSFGNLFGGSTLTISSVGFKNFVNAQRFNKVQKDLLQDNQGNFVLQLKNGKSVKDKKQLIQWMGEKGLIDSFIQGEFDVNTNIRNLSAASMRNLRSFKKELAELWKNDPNLRDETVLELAKRYKVDKFLIESGAWFMQSSERKLRRDAFVAHALQYRDRWGRYGSELTLNDPAVVQAGLKGIEATQFLYHSAFRPAYMRTALGKVLTRFKLFVFNSVRTRKEFFRQAKYYGFEKGTASYEKFKTDFQINMFVMALANLLPYSLFDTALPPPYDWAQETSEWLFGNKREREKAFFGQWPYPIAPLNVITPPVARIPMEFFTSLINNDWERFADYHVYTMFPYGRLVRSVDKTIDEPYGTTFGRLSQQFAGIPTDKIKSRIDKRKLINTRRRMIERELEDLSKLEGIE